MSRKLPTPSREDLEEAYGRLGSISALAREYQTSNPTVRKWLKGYGIELKTHSEVCGSISTDHVYPQGRYLTEDILCSFLMKLHPDHQFTRNKTIPGSGVRYRPDLVDYTDVTIVEFDGYQHYQDPIVQDRDDDKDETYGRMGFKVVRWPYFVQLSTTSIKYFLNVDVQYEQAYPHGFHAERVVFPAAFNSHGVKRFNSEMCRLPDEIRNDIESSLRDAAVRTKSRLVYA